VSSAPHALDRVERDPHAVIHYPVGAFRRFFLLTRAGLFRFGHQIARRSARRRYRERGQINLVRAGEGMERAHATAVAHREL
jgi:hypothetical protein